MTVPLVTGTQAGAGLAARPAPGTPDTSRDAWRREMERAHMEAWLQHGTLERDALGKQTPDRSTPERDVSPDRDDTASAAVLGQPVSAMQPVRTLASPLMPPYSESATPKAPPEKFGPQPHDGATAGRSASEGQSSATGPSAVMPASSHSFALGNGARIVPQQPIEGPSARASSLTRDPVLRADQLESFARALAEQCGVQARVLVEVTCAPAPAGPATISDDFAHAAALPPSAAAPQPGSVATPRQAAIAAPGQRDRPSSAASAARTGEIERLVASPPARQQMRSEIRVHAQWTADGVRIWLGLDASVAAQAPLIAEQIRVWVKGQGARVIDLHCNGTRLDAATHKPECPVNLIDMEHKEETRWPSAL